MPRAIWSGSISFGLVSLPVKVYSATERQRIEFDLLHDEDGAKLEYRRVCPVHDEVVDWEHVIRGYQIEPGRYVTFTKEELAALQPESTHSVDIEDFVRIAEIDPMYFDTPYYLVPEPGARRAYDLLHRVMTDAGVVAVARMVMRTRERLVAIRPLGSGVLAMETLHFAGELRTPPTQDADEGERGAARSEPSAREVKMARSLVDELTVEFDPTSYHDTWHERVLERIEQKAAGELVEAPNAEAAPSTPATDIMAALEASLAAAREQREGGARRSAAPTRARSRANKAKAPVRRT